VSEPVESTNDFNQAPPVRTESPSYTPPVSHEPAPTPATEVSPYSAPANDAPKFQQVETTRREDAVTDTTPKQS
jgi:hypothetical protein